MMDFVYSTLTAIDKDGDTKDSSRCSSGVSSMGTEEEDREERQANMTERHRKEIEGTTNFGDMHERSVGLRNEVERQGSEEQSQRYDVEEENVYIQLHDEVPGSGEAGSESSCAHGSTEAQPCEDPENVYIQLHDEVPGAGDDGSKLARSCWSTASGRLKDLLQKDKMVPTPERRWPSQQEIEYEIVPASGGHCPDDSLIQGNSCLLRHDHSPFVKDLGIDVCRDTTYDYIARESRMSPLLMKDSLSNSANSGLHSDFGRLFRENDTITEEQHESMYSSIRCSHWSGQSLSPRSLRRSPSPSPWGDALSYSETFPIYCALDSGESSSCSPATPFTNSIFFPKTMRHCSHASREESLYCTIPILNRKSNRRKVAFSENDDVVFQEKTLEVPTDSPETARKISKNNPLPDPPSSPKEHSNFSSLKKFEKKPSSQRNSKSEFHQLPDPLGASCEEVSLSSRPFSGPDTESLCHSNTHIPQLPPHHTHSLPRSKPLPAKSGSKLGQPTPRNTTLEQNNETAEQLQFLVASNRKRCYKNSLILAGVVFLLGAALATFLVLNSESDQTVCDYAFGDSTGHILSYDQAKDWCDMKHGRMVFIDDRGTFGQVFIFEHRNASQIRYFAYACEFKHQQPAD